MHHERGGSGSGWSDVQRLDESDVVLLPMPWLLQDLHRQVGRVVRHQVLVDHQAAQLAGHRHCPLNSLVVLEEEIVESLLRT